MANNITCLVLKHVLKMKAQDSLKQIHFLFIEIFGHNGSCYILCNADVIPKARSYFSSAMLKDYHEQRALNGVTL